MVGRSSRRTRSGWEALPKVRERLGDTFAGPVVVWSPKRMVGRPFRRVGNGLEALPQNREWLGGPPGEQAEVGRPFQRYGRGWEAHPE